MLQRYCFFLEPPNLRRQEITFSRPFFSFPLTISQLRLGLLIAKSLPLSTRTLGSAEPMTTLIAEYLKAVCNPFPTSSIHCRRSHKYSAKRRAKQIIFKAGYENNLLFYVQKEKMCIFVAQKYTSKVWQRNRRIRPPSVLKRQYGLTSELSGLFAESHRLEDEIKKQLGSIGFEIG